MHIDNYCEGHAAANAQFAIAYALLQLAKQQGRVADKLGQIGFDGPANNMGALGCLGLKLGGVAAALDDLSVSAEVSGKLDINNA